MAFGDDVSQAAERALTVVHHAISVAITVLILRRERVRLTQLGLAPAIAFPAIAAFGVVWTWANLVAIALSVVTNRAWGIQLLWDGPLGVFLLTLAFWLAAGMAEEFVFRGYLQTKLIALLGDHPLGIRIGIAAASVIFAATHIPRALTGDVGTADTALAYLLTIVVSGLALGLVYEFTQNLYFVAFLHGFGNTVPLVVGWGSGTLWILVTYVAVVPIILGYRYWMARTGHTPVVSRKEAPLNQPGHGHAGRS